MEICNPLKSEGVAFLWLGSVSFGREELFKWVHALKNNQNIPVNCKFKKTAVVNKLSTGYLGVPHHFLKSQSYMETLFSKMIKIYNLNIFKSLSLNRAYVIVIPNVKSRIISLGVREASSLQSNKPYCPQY